MKEAQAVGYSHLSVSPGALTHMSLLCEDWETIDSVLVFRRFLGLEKCMWDSLQQALYFTSRMNSNSKFKVIIPFSEGLIDKGTRYSSSFVEWTRAPYLTLETFNKWIYFLEPTLGPKARVSVGSSMEGQPLQGTWVAHVAHPQGQI